MPVMFSNEVKSWKAIFKSLIQLQVSMSKNWSSSNESRATAWVERNDKPQSSLKASKIVNSRDSDRGFELAAMESHVDYNSATVSS